MSRFKELILLFQNKLPTALSVVFLFFSIGSYAVEEVDIQPPGLDKTQIFSSGNIYQPYFELGGAKYFHQSSSVAAIYDFFIPLLQQEDQLLFTDLRIFDRSGTQCEGNLHLGFRKLFPESNQMFGIYGAFDLKRSVFGNNFKQITFGLEYWLNKFFVGANVYKPIGATIKSIPGFQESMFTDIDRRKLTKKTNVSISQKGEKALTGVDAEIGYAVTERLTGYVGGYYFGASDVDKVAGPKARITYDYLKPHGRILKIFDGVSVELGGQHDNQRGNSGYVEIKFKIGLTSFARNSNIQGFARHMVELVRRDQDIVVVDTKPQVVATKVIAETPMTDQEIEDFFAGFSPEELNKTYNLLKQDPDVSLDVLNRWKRSLGGEIKDSSLDPVTSYFYSVLSASMNGASFLVRSALSGALSGVTFLAGQKLKNFIFGGLKKGAVFTATKFVSPVVIDVLSRGIQNLCAYSTVKYSYQVSKWLGDNFVATPFFVSLMRDIVNLSPLTKYAYVSTKNLSTWQYYLHLVIHGVSYLAPAILLSSYKQEVIRVNIYDNSEHVKESPIKVNLAPSTVPFVESLKKNIKNPHNGFTICWPIIYNFLFHLVK